jgi:MFS family permease
MCIEIFAFFYEPVLSIRLETGFDMGSDTIGYVFAVAGISYGLGAILVGHICNKYTRQYLVLIGFLIQAVGMFLFGPSKTMGLPNDLEVLICGFSLIGFSLAFVTIPVIPEVLSSVTHLYRKEGFASATLNDRVAGLNSTFLGLG